MKGFLFIPEMAVAACQDRKTNTRRVMVPQPDETHETADRRSYRMAPKVEVHDGVSVAEFHYTMGEIEAMPCDYKVGDRRCLLTTWAVSSKWDELPPIVAADAMLAPFGHAVDPTRENTDVFWHAGMGTPKPDWAGKSRPGRFLPNHLRPLMPVFEVTAVRAERVQDISEEDAIAEGVRINRFEVWHWRDDSAIGGADALEAFTLLWDTVNAKRGFGWAENPWVWRIEFRRVISQLSAT